MIEPGQYEVALFGKGKFAGNRLVRYAIQKAANLLEVKSKTTKVKYKKLRKGAYKLKIEVKAA
jgi:hypothetical protein